jgi:demethoxyubiquinone hydroxylase (CLK1/Coq7/Cat5 family)
MASSGMLRRVARVRTDVSERIVASIIRVTRIGELGTLAQTMGAIRSSETSVLARVTQRQIPEDGILHRPICPDL